MIELLLKIKAKVGSGIVLKAEEKLAFTKATMQSLVKVTRLIRLLNRQRKEIGLKKAVL